MKENKLKKLTIEEIKRCSVVKNIKKDVFITELDKKQFLIQRKGKCDWKKCNNACCKFIHSGQESSNFFAGFGDKGKHSGYVIKKKCKYLSKCGLCKIWKHKSRFPKPCNDFPQINDGHYWEVFNVCSFYFEVIEEIKIKQHKMKVVKE